MRNIISNDKIIEAMVHFIFVKLAVMGCLHVSRSNSLPPNQSQVFSVLFCAILTNNQAKLKVFQYSPKKLELLSPPSKAQVSNLVY